MLTKSDFCLGIQCTKQLWLKYNKPDEQQLPIDPLKARNGREVGQLAREFFKCNAIIQLSSQEHMVKETDFYMERNTLSIAEASFMSDRGFCSVDILINRGDRKVEIFEVKSSKTENAVKDETYIYDLAYQYRILTDAEYDVIGAYLVTVNGEYKRDGALNLAEFFDITDMMDEVTARQPIIKHTLDELVNVVEEPSVEIGMQCFSPRKCGFFEYCTRDVPHPNVFDLATMQNKTKLKYFANGIRTFSDLMSAPDLKRNYRIQVEQELYANEPYIDIDGIKSFLSHVSYPLYYLDFETIYPAIPMFDGASPYDQIPFQYSLHYKLTRNGSLRHKEFLAYPGKDPRRELAERLCEDIPYDACVIVYNQGFEKTRLKELAELYPDLADKLYLIRNRILDLWQPFKEKCLYTKGMHGLSSIKAVLPALFPDDPELNYANLEGVHKGSEASEMFLMMQDMNTDELEKCRQELLAYCALDTYATVKVLEYLERIVG